jgi:hypothetical protein
MFNNEIENGKGEHRDKYGELIEAYDPENPEEVTVFVPSFGECTIISVFDPDRMGNGDYYEVYDENNEFVCELPFNIDLDDEEELADMIEDAVETDDIINDYNDDMNNLYDYEDEEDDLDEDTEEFECGDSDEFSEEDDIEEKALNEWDEYDDYDDDDYDDEEENEKYTLVGIDGNAFSVMGYVSQCMKQEGMSRQEIEDYRKEAMSGDYNNLLVVSQEMIDFLNNESSDNYITEGLFSKKDVDFVVLSNNPKSKYSLTGLTSKVVKFANESFGSVLAAKILNNIKENKLKESWGAEVYISSDKKRDEILDDMCVALNRSGKKFYVKKNVTIKSMVPTQFAGNVKTLDVIATSDSGLKGKFTAYDELKGDMIVVKGIKK